MRTKKYHDKNLVKKEFYVLRIKSEEEGTNLFVSKILLTSGG